MSEGKRDLSNLVLMGMGNPLLDISAEVPEEMLTKYEVKLNNAILAEPKHLPIYEELVEKYAPTYIAGGATQNTIRVAQWMLHKPGATAYIGGVGKDKFGAELRKAAEGDKVMVFYQEDEKTPTGTCAVLINKKERSLIANLGAANTYKPAHLLSDAIRPVWQSAKTFYIAGFFLTVSPESILHVAKHANETGKTFCMGLAAPFVCQFFSEPLMQAMPYIDFLFGNESEATAFGQKQAYTDTSPQAVAEKIAALPKASARARTVIITQGKDATIVVHNGKVTLYPVPPLKPEEIVDVNGAGDAFTGGFLSQIVQGGSVEKAIKAGHYAASVILGVSGTKLPAHAPVLKA